MAWGMDIVCSCSKGSGLIPAPPGREREELYILDKQSLLRFLELNVHFASFFLQGYSLLILYQPSTNLPTHPPIDPFIHPPTQFLAPAFLPAIQFLPSTYLPTNQSTRSGYKAKASLTQSPPESLANIGLVACVTMPVTCYSLSWSWHLMGEKKRLTFLKFNVGKGHSLLQIHADW